MDYPEIEKLFDGLRVSDVRDGMDWIGLFSKGSVHRDIRPLFEGARLAGPALTVRLTASQRQAPFMTPDEYTEWARDFWYKEVHIEPYAEEIKKGDVVVIEAPDQGVGQLGSWNTLNFYLKGAQGVVTSGGVRDTDECRIQKVPVFAQFINQTMTQGRIEYLEHNVPITVGNQLVKPGDIIVGDGDGVIVVPIEHVEEVAKYARQEAENDKRGRRRMYEQLGWALDDTVQVDD
ncbi:RraA family protein [Amnibacterium flavum]|uniref:Putative 4-hydroxy-4-methyl-2-oxoglutarate aldolase n=1 Tax=Amnibacterium flavum TaxID=2173173 RepID=A0A2V1HXA7_9MICO|nr:RraA family protein [Amnibacterium flavum]PVZ94924.1 demethylmenaquinone methyltransferase [Amnibacterium flavum]